MKDEQRVVAEWMRRVLQLRSWSAEEWARRARVAPTTITRGMQESYPSVTSLAILHKLARAAKVDSPLDLLHPGRVLVAIPEARDVVAALPDEVVEQIREAMVKQLHLGPKGSDS